MAVGVESASCLRFFLSFRSADVDDDGSRSENSARTSQQVVEMFGRTRFHYDLFIDLGRLFQVLCLALLLFMLWGAFASIHIVWNKELMNSPKDTRGV